MIELILLILALLSLFSSAEAAAFFLVFAAGVIAWKRRILANELEDLRKLLLQDNDAVHRELAELRRMLARAADLQAKPTAAEPASQRPVEAQKPPSAPVSAPPVEDIRKPAPQPEPVATKPPITPRVTPPAAQPVQQPPVPRPVQAPIAPPVASQPFRPTEPVFAAQRTHAPVAPMRVPTQPEPTFADRLKSALALEEVLGTNWLNKLGVIILVLGVALFGIYELGELGPIGKVLVLIAVGIALLGGGIYLEKKSRYQIIGRTAIGGGWALLFFTTYAMHHVHAMRVIPSETVDLALMLGVAVFMALHTLRYRSQVVTGIAFLLAYSTIALSHDTVYALAAGAVLAIGIVIITVKMNWYELEVFGILSSYLNHFYWLFKLLGPEGANHRMFPEFYASAAILILYWVTYRFSYVVRRIDSAAEEKVSTVAALLNTIALLGVMKFQSARPEMAFYALLVLGALELGCGQLPLTRKRRPAFVQLSVMGIVLMLAAVPFRYSGESVSILWLLGGELLLAAGIILKEVVFRRMGLLTGLLVGAHLLGIDSVLLFRTRATSQAPLLSPGVLLFTCGVLYYVNAHLLARRWRELISNGLDDKLLLTHSYLGGVTSVLAFWAVAPNDWTALGWAAMLVLLTYASRRLAATDLFIQAALLGGGLLARTVLVNLRLFESAGPHIQLRYILVPVIAGCFYVSAAILRREQDEARGLVRQLLSWSGTALLALLIWTEVPAPWIPIAWLGLGVALVLAGSRWKLAHLAYQENVLAVAAIARLVAYNYGLTTTHGHITLRVITIAIAAAVFYAISRRSADPRYDFGRVAMYLHTWAATALLAALAWYEAPNAWLVVIWIAFALALALVGRLFKIEELPWQTHVLSLITILRAVGVNIHVTNIWHGVSVRLISLLFVAGVLYLLTRVVPMREDWRKQQLHHAYSTIASVLVAAVMWYELQPLSVAVAWGLFGVVLFEIGLLRKVLPLRMQGYVALAAAFARIFFVNLAAAPAANETLGPRITTVVPLAAIFFFVYWQATERDQVTERELRVHVPTLLAYIGSITVVALLYFQVPGGWIAAGWSMMVVTLLGAALLFSREVFLHQGLLLSVATLSRGVIHNLYGSSYFTESGWRGRYFEIGAAVLVLAAGLPLAFLLRRKYPIVTDRGAFHKFLTGAASRPEQVLFFVPVLLTTLMLALKMRAGMVTVAWGIEALIVIVLALSVGERSFRLTGLALLLLCVGKILIIDAWRLAPRDRYITFIVLGLALLTVSFLYSRYRETIRQYL